MEIRHIFKVDPIGFHGGADVVYMKKRKKENFKTFVLINCHNGFTMN